MTVTQTQEAPHRRARDASAAARIGQFTGALPGVGGVAARWPRRHGCAWAGQAMVSALRPPRGVLAIAARRRPVWRRPGT